VKIRTTGLQLSEDFYRSDIQPILADAYPRLRHAAALMGRGSEVLGFDDEMSTDHDWSAKVIVFVGTVDADQVEAVQHELRAVMPSTFNEVPTRLDITTVAGYFQRELGLNVSDQWDAYDWLSLPEHRLCAVTSGGVFHDEVGLNTVRERLSYYPRDVWYYLLGAGWWRLHPEMNLVGRSGYAGDDFGSALTAADMVSALMHLSFLIERRYAPYRKWFGTAFARLDIANALAPELQRVLRSHTWQDREQALAAAYEVVATAFNALGITDPLPLERTRLWERPFAVLWADYPTALSASITDPATQELMRKWSPAGGVDQVRDILWTARCKPAVRQLTIYER
jgi:Domain of unknown function (DUF4037)